MSLKAPPRDTVHALALQHFAFLLDHGFVLGPEDKVKGRSTAEVVRYRGKQWEIDLDLQYRDGWYVVALVPLVDSKPRTVPFGYRTSYDLLQHVSTHLGIEDEEITSLAEYRANGRPFAEMLTVEYADDILARYAQILARYLDQILASPHPPVGHE